MQFQVRQTFGAMILVSSLAVTSALTTSVHAGVTVLGDSGWQARWDNSVNGQVDIDFIEVVGNTVFIQKSAEFKDPAVNGSFAPIVITMEQIGASTINRFVMDDEIITNSTGSTWTGFMMKANNNPNVHFNPEATLASGGPGPIGFSIAPFTTAVYENDNKVLNISGGLLTSGDIWYPGIAANGGQLVVDVQSGGIGDFQSFHLTEKPMATVVP